MGQHNLRLLRFEYIVFLSFFTVRYRNVIWDIVFFRRENPELQAIVGSSPLLTMICSVLGFVHILILCIGCLFAHINLVVQCGLFSCSCNAQTQMSSADGLCCRCLLIWKIQLVTKKRKKLNLMSLFWVEWTWEWCITAPLMNYELSFIYMG